MQAFETMPFSGFWNRGGKQKVKEISVLEIQSPPRKNYSLSHS